MLRTTVGRSRGLATLAALKRTAGEVATRPVRTVEPDVSIRESLAKTGGGGALIVHEAGDGHRRSVLHGVITERDFLVKTAVDDGTRYALFDPTVREFMTPVEQIQFAEPSWPLHKCLAVMLQGGFRHLPVREVHSKGVEAMLSLRDIVAAVVEDLSLIHI